MNTVQKCQAAYKWPVDLPDQCRSGMPSGIQSTLNDRDAANSGITGETADPTMQQPIDSITPEVHIQLNLLGNFQANRDGTKLNLSSRKAQLVLAYLAVARRKQARRDTLATLFWEEAEPQQARNSLRQTLSRLRCTLQDDGKLMWADGESIGLHQDAWDIDVDFLLDESKRVDSDEETPLLGEFLQGLVSRGASISQWLDNQRQHTQSITPSARPVSTNVPMIRSSSLIVCTTDICVLIRSAYIRYHH
ncbi:MAG: AfsR/SARP family transcriptional regulator [Pseudomonadales bacterium]